MADPKQGADETNSMANFNVVFARYAHPPSMSNFLRFYTIFEAN